MKDCLTENQMSEILSVHVSLNAPSSLSTWTLQVWMWCHQWCVQRGESSTPTRLCSSASCLRPSSALSRAPPPCSPVSRTGSSPPNRWVWLPVYWTCLLYLVLDIEMCLQVKGQKKEQKNPKVKPKADKQEVEISQRMTVAALAEAMNRDCGENRWGSELLLSLEPDRWGFVFQITSSRPCWTPRWIWTLWIPTRFWTRIGSKRWWLDRGWSLNGPIWARAGREPTGTPTAGNGDRNSPEVVIIKASSANQNTASI